MWRDSPLKKPKGIVRSEAKLFVFANCFRELGSAEVKSVGKCEVLYREWWAGVGREWRKGSCIWGDCSLF